MKGTGVLLAIVCLIAPPAFAQPPAAPAADPYAEHPPIPYSPIDPASIPHIDFDIATFKPSKPESNGRTFDIPVDGDGFTFTNRPIHDLIRYAFSRGRGGAYQISGPSWVDTDHYDVQARVAPEDLAKWKALSPIGKRLAIQGFVLEYFKLKYHPDPTNHPYYALVVSKGGPRMQIAKPGETYKTSKGQPLGPRTILWTSSSDLTADGCEMERLADWLTGYTDLPVLDHTGLRDYYDFSLHFDGAPDPNNPTAPDIPFLGLRPGDATPSAFSAVKEIGLELKPAKGPLDSMVIDSISRPPEN